MPLSGGAAAKYGDRYEGKWTVRCLADLMAEAAIEMRLEDPGDEGKGCEFWLKRPDATIEYHQVKRQHATPRAWTIGDLNHEGVLANAYAKTSSGTSRFVFISMLGSSQLAELTDAAQRARSLSEFANDFMTSDFKKDAWRALLRYWVPLIHEELGLDPNDDYAKKLEEKCAYERLQRINCSTIDEAQLETLTDAMLKSLVFGVSPNTLRAELAGFVLEHVHAWLDPGALWKWVEGKGYGHRDYASDTTVTTAILDQNRRYDRTIRPIAGSISMQRSEAQHAFEILEGEEEKDSVLMSGAAGIGKSGVLAQTIEMLRNEGIPTLCFRVDRLTPTLLPRQLGKELGLPESPAHVLAVVARYGPSVLVIDQLDDVSRASGRNPSFFDCIDEIIQQARELPNVHLLMACRAFDLQKDGRLRELVSEKGPAIELPVSPFSVAEVRSVLEQLGQDAGSMAAEQIELLRLPLHLAMYAEVLSSAPGNAQDARSKIELFGAFWEAKRNAVSNRLAGKPCQWVDVIDRLCERLTAERTLFIDRPVLDGLQDTADVMLTENVLVLEEERIGFFHATFFDYAFARRFVSQRRDVLAYILEGEQGLFKRPVLRQIIIYWLEKASADYVDAIRGLLMNADVRFHLKHCAIGAIEQSEVANTLLWDMFEEVLSEPDATLNRIVENLLAASPAWFSFLHETGRLSIWLSAAEPALRTRGQRCVLSQIEQFPDECASLLAPHVGETPEWDAWILRILSARAMSTNRRLFDIFLLLVDRDAVPSDSGADFWMYLYSLHENAPAWAAEALAAHLERRFKELSPEDFEAEVVKKSVHGDEAIPKIGEESPREFLERILPVFLKIVERSAKPSSNGLRADSVWTFRCYGSAMNVGDALLEGLEKALMKVAADAPDEFQHYLYYLAQYGNYDSVNFLLMRAFAHADATCADWAVEYMLEVPERLESGWQMGGASGQYWAAREAVLCLSSVCSGESFERLQTHILSYWPEWERCKEGYVARGRWQLIMLTALDEDRRSQPVESRIRELKRKFPEEKITPPAPITMDWIGPPIPEPAASRMSDANWLNAISKYDTDRDHISRDRRIRGGAVQLSRVLEAETGSDPERFARLALGFTSETNPYYFDGILQGLRKAEVAKDTVFDVVRYFFGLPAKPGARWMSDVIAKYSAEDIPDDILGIVGWLATEAADPETDDVAESWSAESAKDERPDNYLNKAINSVRGSAAEDIGYLLRADAERIPFFAPYLRKVVADPTTTVRSTAAHALLGLFAYDEDLAVDLFLALSETESDILLATPYVDRFLYHANVRHFARLRPIVERMLSSAIDVVREAGARHVCLAQFSANEASELAASCVSGDEAQRKGAAAVAAANAFNSDCREFCESALSRLFDDPSEDVRDAASRCFLHAKDSDLESCKKLIQVFLESRSFPEHGEYLIRGLTDSTGDLASVLVEACEGVLEALENPSADPFGPLHLEARDLAELVFRAYSHSEDPGYRSRCLDMIDRFIAAQAYGVTKQLAEFER